MSIGTRKALTQYNKDYTESLHLQEDQKEKPVRICYVCQRKADYTGEMIIVSITKDLYRCRRMECQTAVLKSFSTGKPIEKPVPVVYSTPKPKPTTVTSTVWAPKIGKSYLDGVIFLGTQGWCTMEELAVGSGATVKTVECYLKYTLPKKGYKVNVSQAIEGVKPLQYGLGWKYKGEL